ncbi:nuclear speckle splicing regulatory protein 1-like [Schistocerca gregaria]|uniref:nuclear speckle splicing regulatory protein 1-like n=1 Tax=Schistocerca gregaria TaxID=7010 RepID=UPI00211F180C|nr:nuclear speckle splicing regulatory protein 1-like [Schistocerca gregaria]XP_049852366.1 nuclear speckle splicing regulatory protein 1-like [Schistocerca gregaria]
MREEKPSRECESELDEEKLFGYDEVYDEMKKEEVRKEERNARFGYGITTPSLYKGGSREAPRYIENLMKCAEERNQGRKIAYQRKLQRENEALLARNEKMECYISEEYKKKLEELKVGQGMEEPEEEGGGDIGSFYFNLKNNVALGAERKESSDRREGIEREGGLDKPKTDRVVRRDTWRSSRAIEKKQALIVERKNEEKVTRKKPRRNNESDILAARERYLQRKAARAKEEGIIKQSVGRL